MEHLGYRSDGAKPPKIDDEPVRIAPLLQKPATFGQKFCWRRGTGQR